MKSLRQNSETDVLVDVYGTYLLAKLDAREETREIRDTFEKVQIDLETAKGETKKNLRQISRAKASKNEAYLSLVEEIRDFQRALLKSGSGDRNNGTYKLYFPQGMVHLTQASQDELVSRMERILINLEGEGSEELKNLYPSLQAEFEAFNVESQKVENAYLAYQKAFSRELSSRMEWHRAYKKCEAALVILFDANKKKVKHFFLKKVKSRKKDEEKKDEEKKDDPPKTEEEGSRRLIVVR